MKVRTVAILLCALVPWGARIGLARGYSGGSGTPQDPYLIADANDLAELGSNPADRGKHFQLVMDIDLSGRTWGTNSVIPMFSGTFDGKGLSIRNLRITADNSDNREGVGLFGQLTSGAQIKDLTVADVHVEGSGNEVGGLVGINGHASILRCSITGSVTGKGSNVGGLAGITYQASVVNCSSTAAVSGKGNYVGGLVGVNWETSVVNSHTGGSVTGTGDDVGGLVGDNDQGSVFHCYSTAAVTGSKDVGGLVGDNRGSVSTCYSTGRVFGTDRVGGLIGYSLGSVSHCFWDTDVSGCTWSNGGTGLTTAPMHDPNTFIQAGWDFAGEPNNGTSEVWQMPGGGGYPALSAFNRYDRPTLSGQGTVDDPYLISTAADLGMVGRDPRACYRLAASIDLAGIRWSGPVIPVFAGTFDGHGLCIRNLTITGAGFLGLFGSLLSGAQVRDLGLVDVCLEGSGDCVGGLVGYNYMGTLSSNCTTGRVYGGNSVGGLVGYNYGYKDSINILKCFSTAAVTGNSYVGGLVGYTTWGKVLNGYSTGAVVGRSYVGGLVGYCYWTSVLACYSTGPVFADVGFAGGLAGWSGCCVSHCFWDTETSGRGLSAGGTGLTTAQMKDPQTYLDDPWWDADVWTMPKDDYPRLRWEQGRMGPTF